MTIYPVDPTEITSIIGSDQTDTGFHPVPITNRTSLDFGPILANFHLEDLYQDCVLVKDVVPILHQMVTYGYESQELGRIGEKLVPGVYRRIEVICGEYYPPLPADIPQLMGVFYEKLEELLNSGEVNTIPNLIPAITAFAGVTLLAIHPFSDGNGRTARALMDYVEYYIRRRLGMKPDAIRIFQRKAIESEQLDKVTQRDTPNPYTRFLSDYYYGYDRGVDQPPRQIVERLVEEGEELTYFNKLANRFETIITNVSPRILNQYPWRDHSRGFSSRRNVFDWKEATMPAVLSRYLVGIEKRRREYKEGSLNRKN